MACEGTSGAGPWPAKESPGPGNPPRKFNQKNLQLAGSKTGDSVYTVGNLGPRNGPGLFRGYHLKSALRGKVMSNSTLRFFPALSLVLGEGLFPAQVNTGLN